MTVKNLKRTRNRARKDGARTNALWSKLKFLPQKSEFPLS